MIRFKQKEFFWGLAVPIAGTVVGMGQQASANKAQEKANEEAAEEQRRHNSAMEKAAEKAQEKQKSYTAAPPVAGGKGALLGNLMNGAMAVGTVAGIAQTHNANKEQKASNEQNLIEQKRHNKQIEEAAKANPSAAFNAEKSFAAISTLRNAVKLGVPKFRRAARKLGNTQIGGFVQDLASTQKDNIKKTVGMGASFAAMGYAGNRLATSIKDAKENNNKGNKKFLAKAAITAGTITGGVLAAKYGKLGPTAQKFMTTGRGGKALNSLGKAVNPIVRDKDGKINTAGTLMKNGMNAVFIGGPTFSYLSKKKAENDMVGNTQREFASTAATMRFLRMNAKKLVKHPGRVISSGLNRASSFMGMYGNGGTRYVQNTGQSLLKAGRARDARTGTKSLTTKVGEWITKTDANGNLVNAGKANLLATAGTVAAGTTAMGIGSAVVNKPAKLLDRDAFKMEEKGNGTV